MRHFSLLIAMLTAVSAALAAPFDIDIFGAVQRSGAAAPWQLRQAMVDVTALGGFTVLTLAATVAALALLLSVRRRDAAAVVSAYALASLLTETVKGAIERPRPDLATQLVHAVGMSFPSGHATQSAALYFTLAAVIARAAPSFSPLVRATSLFLVLMIAYSRVFLGVHWPSDALAGVAIGAAIAWLAARLSSTRGDARPVGGAVSTRRH